MALKEPQFWRNSFHQLLFLLVLLVLTTYVIGAGGIPDNLSAVGVHAQARVLRSQSVNQSATVPLPSAEQTAVLDFVERGGCAIRFRDNDTFDPNAPQTNESLIDPFDMDMKVYLPSVHKDTACTTDKTTSGRMMEDEIWCGDVLITGDVEIPQGVTLTIKPGATIRFTAQRDDQHSQDEYDPEDPSTWHATMIVILVLGKLDAQGTSDQPIVFTSDSDVPGPMDWQSITMEDDGTVILDHVVIEHGHFGLQLNSPTLHASISHSTIRYVTTTGIATGDHPISGPIIISDSQFIACGREAIDTYRNQNIIVDHNVFSDNYVAIMSVGSSITIDSNLFIRNIRGVGVVEDGNPTITGNEFTENSGAAIFVTNASPIITNNNIYANLWSIQLEGSERGVTAENNWWGSADIETIAESILDGKDDPTLGIVDFEPFAVEAFDLDVPECE